MHQSFELGTTNDFKTSKSQFANALRENEEKKKKLKKLKEEIDRLRIELQTLHDANKELIEVLKKINGPLPYIEFLHPSEVIAFLRLLPQGTNYETGIERLNISQQRIVELENAALEEEESWRRVEAESIGLLISIPNTKEELNGGTKVAVAVGNGEDESLIVNSSCKPALMANDALVIHGARKKYGKTLLLNDFHMRVKQKSIYCLIGASGCGKTTILSCIVGLKKLESGSIYYFGEETFGLNGKQVGYMPQEIALWGEFTIGETMAYFGRMNKMHSGVVKEKTQFLIDFLQLPPKNRTIHTLSGGQQRRVSFAVALLHQPQFLILDEPTVGVDSVLRECIWSYLRDLTYEGCTVLMTTHYMEEAKRADVVGLMRSGRLLAQDSPQKLTKAFNADLDAVLLALSRDDDQKEKAELTEKILKRKNSNAKRIPSSTVYKLEMNHLHALIIKNLIYMWRNIGFMTILGFLPAVQLALFCVTIGGDFLDLDLAYVNHETDNCSVPLKPCINKDFSCRYLTYLKQNHSVLLHKYDNESEALLAVQAGQAWGVISFGPKFSKHVINRAEAGHYADQDTIDGSRIKARLDMSNQQIAYTIKRMLLETYQRFAKNLARCHLEADVTGLPIKFEEPIYGDEYPVFSHYIAPGALLTTIFFMGVALTGQILISEKKGGMLERSYVAGMRHSELILSHLVTQSIVLYVQITIVFSYLFAVIQLPFRGPISAIVLLTVLQGYVGIFLGFVVTSFAADESQVLQISLMIFIFNFLVSGALWPLESMPRIMKVVAGTMPQAAVGPFRSMIIRGWEIGHPLVFPAFISSLAWILFFILVIFIERRVKVFLRN